MDAEWFHSSYLYPIDRRVQPYFSASLAVGLAGGLAFVCFFVILLYFILFGKVAKSVKGYIHVCGAWTGLGLYPSSLMFLGTVRVI